MKPKAAIIIGHTRMEPGAQAVAPLSLSEYDFNTSLSQRLSVALQESFLTTIYFRDHVGIKGCYGAVKEAGNDVVMELHFNSCDDSKAAGSETLCTIKDWNFAQIIQENMCFALNRLGKEDRGVKTLVDNDRGHYNLMQVFDELEVPAVIIEPFFGSNEKECELILQCQDFLCSALDRALCRWFSLH